VVLDQIFMSATLLDGLMPQFDEVERHELVVRAPVAAVYAAITRTDFADSRVIRVLLGLRALPSVVRGRRRSRGPLTLATIGARDFVQLGERAPYELAIGAVGRFWTPTGGLVPLDADGFRSFDRPGYAKVVWNFTVQEAEGGGARLATETRIWCLDSASRRRFRAYWLLVRPFSGLMRMVMLRAIAREAGR
jgi:hypothetical protein